MELDIIVKRLADQVALVDKSITPNKSCYIPSIGSAKEQTIVRRLLEEWKKSHPNELNGVTVQDRGKGLQGCLEINYPNTKGNQKKLDFGFSSSTAPIGCDNLTDLEWVIEFKKISWVGGTGTDQSERAVGKLCSPYPATGPILSDALRVTKHSYGRRCAVILLSPDVYPDQLNLCSVHPLRKQRWDPANPNDRIIALTNTFKKNNGYAFEADPLLPFVEKIFDYKGVKYSQRVVEKVVGLSAHPVYSRLTIVGWEILRTSST